MRPELLTARSNMSFHKRKLAGLCPVNALEVARLLTALGTPKDAVVYWAGGRPLGGEEALLPLKKEFSHFYNKESLSSLGELEPFLKRASMLAAVAHIVAEKSDIFMPSHGGNMDRAMQANFLRSRRVMLSLSMHGHRAYAGHKKHITPNKREMLPYFLNSTIPETEFNRITQELHQESLGQPEMRASKPGRDVIAYLVSECMCKDNK